MNEGNRKGYKRKTHRIWTRGAPSFTPLKNSSLRQKVRHLIGARPSFVVLASGSIMTFVVLASGGPYWCEGELAQTALIPNMYTHPQYGRTTCTGIWYMSICK